VFSSMLSAQGMNFQLCLPDRSSGTERRQNASLSPCRVLASRVYRGAGFSGRLAISL
jgi:hypothetical protein